MLMYGYDLGLSGSVPAMRLPCQFEETVTIGINVRINTVDIISPFPNIAHAVAVQINHLGLGMCCKEKAGRSR